MHNKNYQSYKLKRTVEGVIIYEAKGIIFYFSKPSRKVADYITKKLFKLDYDINTITHVLNLTI
jgi:DNA-binding MurR/RpiR family transcriptional regulator